MEILSLVVTIVCLLSFSIVFTVLFRHYYLSLIKEIKEGKRDIELIDQAIIEEEEKKSKTKKTIKIILRVISYVLLGGVVIIFGFSLYSRISGNIITTGDHAMIVIASGSMSEKNPANTYLEENHLDNQFDAYDIIQINKYHSQEEVKLYDVVAYKSKDDIVIVHRIIEIRDNNGKKEFLTKGDAVSSADSGSLYYGYLQYEDIIGYYTDYRIPVIGAFVIFLQSNSGIITIISIVYCLLMFDYYRNKYDKEVNIRTNALIELIDYDVKDVDIDKSLFVDYHEKLYYKGQEYIFSEGRFISKSTIDDDELTKLAEKGMIFVKRKGDGDSKIEVKDVEHDEIKSVVCEQSDELDKIDEIFSLKDIEDKEDKGE